MYNVSGRTLCNKKDYVQNNTVKMKISSKQEIKRLSSTTAPSFAKDNNNQLELAQSYTCMSLAARKIVSEYDQEIPQSQTVDNPVAPRGRAT